VFYVKLYVHSLVDKLKWVFFLFTLLPVRLFIRGSWPPTSALRSPARTSTFDTSRHTIHIFSPKSRIKNVSITHSWFYKVVSMISSPFTPQCLDDFHGNMFLSHIILFVTSVLAVTFLQASGSLRNDIRTFRNCVLWRHWIRNVCTLGVAVMFWF